MHEMKTDSSRLWSNSNVEASLAGAHSSRPHGVSGSGPGAWGGGPPACCTALWVCGLPACQALNQDYTKSFWSKLRSLLKKNELLAKNTQRGWPRAWSGQMGLTVPQASAPGSFQVLPCHPAPPDHVLLLQEEPGGDTHLQEQSHHSRGPCPSASAPHSSHEGAVRVPYPCSSPYGKLG